MSHVHNILDSDKRFSINPVTRALENESNGKVMFMQGDHNSERLTFEVPRYVEGHDMSLSTKAQIHYLNVDVPDMYEAKDLQVSPNDEDKVTFSWLVSRTATQKAGQLYFIVKFRCYEEDVIVYEWNTAMFTGISIGSSLDNSQAIVEANSDVLAAWEQRIKALEEGDIEVDLSGYVTKHELEAKGYLTEHQDISGKLDVNDFREAHEAINEALDACLTELPAEYVTETELADKGYQTAEQVSAIVNEALGVIENGAY